MYFDNLTLLAGIGLLTALAQWAAWRARLPAILFLLIVGMVVGPVTGLLDPDALFGDLLFPLISLSVAVILFEGSLTLKFSELREIGSTVRNLVTLGALLTWIITAVIVHWVVGFDYALAALFGAMVVVTGPTVVMPMLRTVRPVRKVANILRWEGIVIDPIGALLAVLAFDFYIAVRKVAALESIVALFLTLLAAGVALGLVAGYGLGAILRRHWLPEYLRSSFTLLIVFATFAIAELIAHESGLLAVTVFGIVLANQRDVEVDDILDFKESLTLLLIGGLFILLAARIELTGLVAMGWPALLVVAGIIFVARPVSVLLSTIRSGLNFRERIMIAWIGPRGIVCAAVAAIFAIRLEAMGAANADLLVPLAFLVIIGTVVLQSLTAKPLAGMLGVRDPAPAGYLIVGGGLARLLGSAIKRHGLRVVIADNNRDAIRQARMEELDTYHGNPVSEHAGRHLDLSGIGNLISMSGRPNMDLVNALHFRGIFGARHIYELWSRERDKQKDKERPSDRLMGARLFGEDMNYETMNTLMRDGWVTRATELTEAFGYDDYLETSLERYGSAPVLLFAVDGTGKLHLATESRDWVPDEGWQVISLVDQKQVIKSESEQEVGQNAGQSAEENAKQDSARGHAGNRT